MLYGSDNKSLRQRMEELEKQKKQEQSQISPEEQDNKARAELSAFTDGLKNKQTKKLHQNDKIPSSPVKEEEKKELNLDKPLHEMTVDERVVYATLHKKEIEENHYTDDKSLKKNKGYAFSALAEALLGTMFDTPDDEEYENDFSESDDIF